MTSTPRAKSSTIGDVNHANVPLDRPGLGWGLVSYVMWGFFPIYWKLLADRSSIEILAHRMAWSFVFYILIYAIVRRRELRLLFQQPPRDWGLSAVAAALLALNWGIYIYAVNSGHVLEGSLAYFINPILNVAVGVAFFREPFPPMMKLAVGFASVGVLAKIFLAPGFPWISLVLAFSFCGYGIAKKLTRVPALRASVLEGAIGFVPAVIAILALPTPPVDPSHGALLAFGGVVTGLPLFLFSFAAQRVPYSVLGLLQFIAPSLQFVVAVAMYGEAFDAHDGVAFGLIWAGTLCYATVKLWANCGRDARESRAPLS